MILKAMALIRNHFHINPEALTDDEFARLLNEAIWLEKFRADVLEGRMKRALVEVLNEAFR